MRRSTILLTALFLASTAISLHSQTGLPEQEKPANPVRIGITGGYAANRHTANFLNNDLLGLFRFPEREGKFPENFREGLGNGLYAGFVATIPLDAVWAISLRASAAQHDALLSTKEYYPTRDGAGNEVDTASYSLHALSVRLPSVGLEALIERRFEGIGLVLQAGFRAAYMVAPSFTYKERFNTSLKDGRGLFVQENSVERVPLGTNSLALPQFAPLQIHILGGLGYELSLGEKLRIRPEAMYALGVTNAFQARVVSGNEPNLWSLGQIRGGVTVTLPLPEKPIPPPPPPVDTVKPAPVLMVKASGLQSNEQTNEQINEQTSVVLRVQQTISRSVFPLLPYIFFDGVAGTAMPTRYAMLKREETSAFRESKLSSAYDLVPGEHSYYHVLNIVGERLRRLPKATLTIHGCTDGFTAERDKADVAKARANVVMRYLREVWDIDASRLKLLDNTLSPTTPSIPLNDADKQAENRRVELRSDVPEILEHITLIDTTRRVSPPTLRFRMLARHLDSVGAWKLTVRESGRIVKEFSGEGAVPPVLDWRVDERELAALHLNNDPNDNASKALEYLLSYTLANGSAEVRSATDRIPLETRTESQIAKKSRTSSFFAGRQIERFNLILFDFAKSAMTAEQQPMMNLMKSRIKPQSSVRVDGFTDRTGEAEFNRKLSLQRALGVAQALGFSAEQQKTNVMGYGSMLELYDNNVPEGRFYSRTVRVIVETPESE